MTTITKITITNLKENENKKIIKEFLEYFDAALIEHSMTFVSFKITNEEVEHFILDERFIRALEKVYFVKIDLSKHNNIFDFNIEKTKDLDYKYITINSDNIKNLK